DWSGGEWAFRVSGEFTDLKNLAYLVVGYSGSSPVRLADISMISEVYEDSPERVRSGLQDLIVVQVTKRETGNVIQMSREIRERLNRLESGGNEGYRFFILHDDSETIRLSLGTVVNSALTGIAMAIAIIFLFLRSWRYTLVVAVSLPVSLVITFAGMKLTGQSINVLTLAGITVSLGMVVDASIVVLENIHRRHASGENADTAALAGAGSVSGAVIASTTTSVSVFAPMMFLTGIIGSVLKDLSLTIVLCLGASLFSALFLIPPLARRGLLKSRYREAQHGLMSKLENSYKVSLKRSLGMSGTVIFTAAAVLAISVLAADLMGLSFIPAADYGELFISLELPPGATLEESTAAADKAESIIRSEVPELTEVVFYAGMEDELSGDARKRESVWGQILLDPPNRRERDFKEIIEELNEVLPSALPGIAVTVFNGGFDRMVSMGVDGSGYRVELSSESRDDLRNAADRVESILTNDPDILSTTRDITEDRRFVTAQLDGEALGQLGVSAAEAALTARIAFEGLEVGKFRPPDDADRTIRLTSTLDGKAPDSESLGILPVRTANGRITTFDSFSSIREETGVSGIRRHDRSRTVTVIGYAGSENIRDISRRLNSVLEEQPLAEGVEWRLKGVGGLVGDSLIELGLILVISLFLVYAVMAIQFERLVQPLIIMASVPFCFIGVIGGLAVSGSEISLISFLGIIALAGIVVNNAIVQVDRINQLRRDGMELDEAVVSGSVSRLRPILMTTLTTFFGVLPLSLARGSGARIYAPLGQAIAGGLVTSTLVTLFLIPTLYRLVEKRGELRYHRAVTGVIPEEGAA
ncbi:MAG: efflux RND transporter permease subunit, partial [Spirochaetaceae bacterium]|nr:efflux RND transporter permease subunit [Spirochaetaceae bacterium]